MATTELDHNEIALECGASAARFLSGSASSYDLDLILHRAGIEAGDVIVIRMEGPRGGPGMRGGPPGRGFGRR